MILARLAALNPTWIYITVLVLALAASCTLSPAPV